MKCLVFDIGGTFIKYALMNEDYQIIEQSKVPSPRNSREELIDTLGNIYDSYENIDGIAISMPGIIDREKGYCAMGGALTYNNDFYLRDALKQRCPVNISMENDAKCAASAEAGVGALKDVDDGFVLLFGTMIGGGYIHNGKVVRGKHFSTGEVSYIITNDNLLPYRENVFGNRCSVLELCRMYAEKKNMDADEVDGFVVFNAVDENDEEAIEVLNEYTYRIAVEIFNLQTILDIERFAIGGGISVNDSFIESIRNNLVKLYDVLPYSVPHAEVVRCKFDNDANLIGALECYLQEFNQ